MHRSGRGRIRNGLVEKGLHGGSVLCCRRILSRKGFLELEEDLLEFEFAFGREDADIRKGGDAVVGVKHGTMAVFEGFCDYGIAP